MTSKISTSHHPKLDAVLERKKLLRRTAVNSQIGTQTVN